MSEDTVTLTAADVGTFDLDPIAAIDAKLVELTNQKMAIREEQRKLTAERDGLLRAAKMAEEQERIKGIFGPEAQIITAGSIPT
ncbi:MAG: hypothetical protein ACREYC_14680 [Gammaproteobacteria bacterium]